MLIGGVHGRLLAAVACVGHVVVTDRVRLRRFSSFGKL